MELYKTSTGSLIMLQVSMIGISSNMLPTLTVPYNGINTCSIYAMNRSFNDTSGKSITFKSPMFLSCCKKWKTRCCSKKVQNFEVEQLKVDGSSMLKLTSNVSLKISNEVDMFKMMMELPFFYWKKKSKNVKSTEKSVGFQLVSTQLDPSTMKPKLSKECVKDWSKCKSRKDNGTEGCLSFEFQFVVDADFGEPGAILVRNNYDRELYVETISIEGYYHFSCNSWIQPVQKSKEKRIFFSNKAYLPSQIPNGHTELRTKELKNKRGDGNALRLSRDRIYDYDTYNDLGNPDKGPDHERPILGGEKNPHPRRCRTGRPSTITEVASENLVDLMTSSIYVPRDEVIEGTRRTEFIIGRWMGVLRNIPHVMEPSSPSDLADRKGLYRNPSQDDTGSNSNGLLKYLDVCKSIKEIFQFETPKNISWDTTSYVRDDELGRQTLAGMNPVSIEKLKVFPPVSTLDPAIYGPPESDLKEEHIVHHLDGMSVKQAMDENKLFILDYHDIYLPFLEKINAQESRKSYGTRTICWSQHFHSKPILLEYFGNPTRSGGNTLVEFERKCIKVIV